VARGPKLDLVGLHAAAIRAQGLKFMVSLHHAYHFNGYYDHVPAQSTATLKKLFAQQGTTAENQLWYAKLQEVIDGYQPDIVWQDFDLNLVQESERLAFLAHYYNQAVAWNKDVVATYKDGLDNLGEVFDFERGGPGGLLTPYWLTDDSISSSSWCYTVGIGYYTTQALLHALIDRVAKGGNMLLNIAPMADGTIPSGQQQILLQMGDWLGRFGEAVYATRSWTSYGEGPTAMGGGSFSGPKAGTAQDIRFTRSKDNTVLYATALGWQGATMTVTTLNSNQINMSTLVSAQLLNNGAGSYTNLPKPTQDGSGLHIAMPSSSAPFSALAYTVKLTFSGQIPALGASGGSGIPTGWTKISNVTTGMVVDGGGSVPSGSALKQWTYDGSTNLQWQFVSLGTGYYRIVNNTNGLVIDSNGNSTAGAAPLETGWSGSSNQQWAVNSQGGGRYQIVNRGTGLCLDGGGLTGNGVPMKMWPVGSSSNLQWTITSA
jgi:alpha-L-fucosidase